MGKVVLNLDALSLRMPIAIRNVQGNGRTEHGKIAGVSARLPEAVSGTEAVELWAKIMNSLTNPYSKYMNTDLSGAKSPVACLQEVIEKLSTVHTEQCDDTLKCVSSVKGSLIEAWREAKNQLLNVAYEDKFVKAFVQREATKSDGTVNPNKNDLNTSVETFTYTKNGVTYQVGLNASQAAEYHQMQAKGEVTIEDIQKLFGEEHISDDWFLKEYAMTTEEVADWAMSKGLTLDTAVISELITMGYTPDEIAHYSQGTRIGTPGGVYKDDLLNTGTYYASTDEDVVYIFKETKSHSGNGIIHSGGSSGATTCPRVEVPAEEAKGYVSYMQNLCGETGMDLPLALAMWSCESGCSVDYTVSKGGTFGTTWLYRDHPEQLEEYVEKYGDDMYKIANNAYKRTYGTDIPADLYQPGKLYYDAALSQTMLLQSNSKNFPDGNMYENLVQYVGGWKHEDSATARFNRANEIREQWGWEQIDYKSTLKQTQNSTDGF